MRPAYLTAVIFLGHFRRIVLLGTSRFSGAWSKGLLDENIPDRWIDDAGGRRVA